MPLAVTLCLDQKTTAIVRRIWRALSETLDVHEIPDLGYAPHVTLAVIEAETIAPSIEAALLGIAGAARRLPITFTGFDTFPGPPPVVWLAPAVTTSLLDLHDRVCAALKTVPVHPHYLPKTWMPHVTLSQTDRQGATGIVEAVMADWAGPVQGESDRIELLSFPPIAIMRSLALRPASD
jgi:2'-5' RNA ligase